MTKSEKLARIYKAIGEEISSEILCDVSPDGEALGDWITETKGYKPVMIGDILEWVDYNCCWEIEDKHRSRNMEEHSKLVMAIYYHFLGGFTKPIDKQPEATIDFIYGLL